METPFEIGIKKAGFRKFSGARRNNQPDEKRETTKKPPEYVRTDISLQEFR
ncbi:MAG: hypothetical protein PUF60_08720 [Firmicutes bacterium]|nr:hypothetical protein [Bacillota bacterium]